MVGWLTNLLDALFLLSKAGNHLNIFPPNSFQQVPRPNFLQGPGIFIEVGVSFQPFLINVDPKSMQEMHGERGLTINKYEAIN